MIVVEKISFAHKKEQTVILENVSFRISPGRRAVLLGPNGSGKSTLFMCLAGLWPINCGKIFLNGKNAIDLDPRQRAKLIAVVPQIHVPQFSYTVFEAVLMGRAPHINLYSSPSPLDRDIAGESLKKIGLAHLANRKYTQISGGERQMVLVARALTQQSPIIVLDEPTTHLDFKNQYEILDLIGQVSEKDNLTVLMTLHDPNLASFFADQVLTLENKSISHDGFPESILNEVNLSGLYNYPVGVLNHQNQRLIFSKKQGNY
jgi:iron complex transport system ATP-binding protein